jgi:hypothetical protein
MLLVFVRTMDDNGTVANTAIAGTVEDRESARRQLDKMVKSLEVADPPTLNLRVMTASKIIGGCGQMVLLALSGPKLMSAFLPLLLEE